MLEEFISEEIEFQDIDRCEEVELLNEQYIEEGIDREKCVIRLTEGQILEEFVLEETELQGIDKCKMVERGIDRVTVDPPEMSVRIAYEKEECIEEVLYIDISI